MAEPQQISPQSGAPPKPPQGPPRAAMPDNQTAALLALLRVEQEARDATNERELILLMVNETRKLTRARQIFIAMPGPTGALQIEGVSSIPVIDRDAPLVAFFERLAREAASGVKALDIGPLEMPEEGEDEAADAYPFRKLVWVPLRHGNGPLRGALILAREDAWTDKELIIARRLAQTYAHALRALKGRDPLSLLSLHHLLNAHRWHAFALAVVFALLLFVRVPISALAPVEIRPRDPFVVAAPIDGVIENIIVGPNQKVAKGDVLVKLADTTLRNRYEVAAREVQVAQARLKQSNQIAFSDPRGMHEIGIARAELALKLAERDFARDLLDKTEIKAERPGLAIYSDKHELIGKPVAVGERILEVADSSSIEARIELPVSDAIALSPGAAVRLFLDSDPLKPWKATVLRADYKAKVGENDTVAFRVIADIEPDSGGAMPRLGVRGTAQVSGDDVTLGFYLFRRPITALRQWIGL